MSAGLKIGNRVEIVASNPDQGTIEAIGEVIKIDGDIVIVALDDDYYGRYDLGVVHCNHHEVKKIEGVVDPWVIHQYSCI